MEYVSKCLEYFEEFLKFLLRPCHRTLIFVSLISEAKLIHRIFVLNNQELQRHFIVTFDQLAPQRVTCVKCSGFVSGKKKLIG
jgi:hypothetical protein